MHLRRRRLSRPHLRRAPNTAPAATEAPASVAASAASPSALEPASPGGILVQLASLPDEAAAHAEWQREQRKMPSLLSDRQPVFVMVTHNGHTLWHVRTGDFTDEFAGRGVLPPGARGGLWLPDQRVVTSHRDRTPRESYASQARAPANVQCDRRPGKAVPAQDWTAVWARTVSLRNGNAAARRRARTCGKRKLVPVRAKSP